MSGLEIAAVAFVAAWLAVLTGIVLLLVRQVSLIQVWAQENTVPESERVRESSIDIGAEIAPPALEVVPQLATDLVYIAFLDGNCQPCREFALEAGRSDDFAQLRGRFSMVTSIRGKDGLTAEIANLLPDWVQIVRGPDADRLAEALDVTQTPSVVEIERGNLTGRAVAGYGLVNFLNLVDAREQSDAAEFAGPPKAAQLNPTASNGGGRNG